MIVVAGEALLDVYADTPTATGLVLDARVGGSPLNVAVGLARLGQPVAFFGAIAIDFLGERLVQALAADGVSLACTARVAAPCTLGFVALDDAGVASYAFYGEGGADRQLLPSMLDTVPADASAIQLGSYAMVVEPAASTLCALVERAQGRLPVAWDINMRLNVEPALARWRERLAWMRPRAQLVKLSDEDLARLEPEAARSDAALDAMAAAWLADGVRLVVLTRGAQGATAWHARAGRVQVPPVPTALVDTVGAGDTFQAAMLAALAERGRLSLEGLAALDERTLGEVLGFATRAAAITCSRRGADLPRRAELG